MLLPGWSIVMGLNVIVEPMAVVNAVIIERMTGLTVAIVPT